ncbi:hypothetical protein QBC35DRAFT_451612 [Podospora australis]|uniref:Uncharacterized protein n=1 Tax=Podospora australis TaxID=1536484 RepID=A0AAN7AJS7_9PEZI|nr:hypothetical protein QBC35DRAFT_451612 [Podospora australis]
MDNLMSHMPEDTTQEQLIDAMDHALSLLPSIPVETTSYSHSPFGAEWVRRRSERTAETGITTDDDYTESEPEQEDDPIDVWDMSNYAGWWVTVEDWDKQFERPGRPVVYGEDTPTEYIRAEPHLDDVPLAVPCHGLHDQIAWFDCIYDYCRAHYQFKVYHEVFPSRQDDNPILKVHRAGSEEDWNFGTTTKGEYTLIVETMIPTGCWDKDALGFEDCEHAWCARHRRAKTRDWHRQKNQAKEWEGYCSKPSEFIRVPRSGNGQRASPGPSGTN